ncbi:MAG: hypothetical protein WC803_12760 [Sphingomonas sp.]|jgi:hypothetical protein
MSFNTKQEPIERYQTYKNTLFTPITRKEQLEAMITGLHRYINSTEENPLLDDHHHKVFYQGTNKPWETLKKWEDKLDLIK